MAANSQKAAKPRGKGKPFAKGQTGNPSGRPKLTPEEHDLIAACKAKTPDALAVIEGLMLESQSDKVRLSAALSIIERAWGKPIQPTELFGKGGGPLTVEIVRFGGGE
jgi:hypothetical protein